MDNPSEPPPAAQDGLQRADSQTVNLSRLLLAAALAASTCAVALPAHAASADQKDKGKDEGKPTVVATVVPGATPADVAATTNGDANGKDKAAKDKPVKDGAVGGTDATTPAVDAPGAPADRPAALAPAAPPVAG